MDGWMDRQMDGWMDGWMDRQMDGWMDGNLSGEETVFCWVPGP